MSQPRRLSQERERSLLTRLRAGEEAALSELYDELAPWVLGVAHRILSDADEAKEVLSDVFVQVWTRIHQHDPRRGPLVPWVLSIARNRALDHLRRRRRWARKAERLGQEPAVADSDATAGSEVAESSVPGWPVHRAVHEALAALPLEQQRAILLAHFEGLSHSEIAHRTGDALGTVKTRLRLAHQKLAQSLEHLRDWVT